MLAAHVGRVDAGDVDLRHAQVQRRALLHTALAEAGQHVADVVEEHPVRADHQHSVAHQPTAVLEQQIRGTVQTDRGLARTGPTLHHQYLVERRTDDDVLLGLDGGDDLLHRAGAGGADLGQHRVGDARTGGVVVGVVELLVEVGGEVAVGQGEPSPVSEAERVGVGGPVERRGDGRPPVDHHRVVGVVLDVTAADVPDVAVLVVGLALLGDAAEELTGARRLQVLQRFGHRDLDVLLGDLVRGGVGVEAREPLDHRVAAAQRELQARPFGAQFGEEVVAHRICDPSDFPARPGPG